jgi:hypothetical protein
MDFSFKFQSTKPLVAFVRLNFSCLFHELSFKCFSFSISDCRRFFEILTLFPFSDNAFFFNHALETLESLLKWLSLVYSDLGDRNHPLFG